MKHLTNAHMSVVNVVIADLTAGRPDRIIHTGCPQKTEAYSTKELVNLGMVGLYEAVEATAST